MVDQALVKEENENWFNSDVDNTTCERKNFPESPSNQQSKGVCMSQGVDCICMRQIRTIYFIVVEDLIQEKNSQIILPNLVQQILLYKVSVFKSHK